MGSGGPGRQAGKTPEGKREGFFLKNPDAKEASSQEGKCLVYVVSGGNQDLDWVVEGEVLQMPQTSEGEASCEVQLSLSEQLAP